MMYDVVEHVCDELENESRFDHLPFFCITCKNLMMTLEEGRITTCFFPRFSALDMVFKVSANTDIFVICNRERDGGTI
jgi:hypothetical protein